MRIRYKFFIACIIIVGITIPVPVYILNKQIEQLHLQIISSGAMQAKLLSQSAVNLLLLNSGNVFQTSLDASEYVAQINQLLPDGLVSLKIILFTPNPTYNGMLLVDIPNNNRLSKISEVLQKKLLEKKTIPYFKDKTNASIEFISQSTLPSSAISCTTWIVYNESILMHSVYTNYMIFGISVFSIIIIAYIAALRFSHKFSKPIETIVHSLQIFDEGSIAIQIPIQYTKDEVGRLATTIQHLLDMVNLEINELTKTNMELLRINKLKDDFLANVSHEIKLPLESITQLSNSIIHSYSNDPATNFIPSLYMIANSALRLSYIIDDILDFTRLKNNDIVLNKKIVDITGAINFVISILKPYIQTKHITIETITHEDARYVYADEQRLLQMLLNILGNSVKDSQNATISIISEKIDSTTLGIAIKNSEDCISQELMASIDNFEYTSVAIDTQHAQWGLGLVITKKLMELHNGSLTIQSIPNDGTLITLRFPFDESLINKGIIDISSYPAFQQSSDTSSSEHHVQQLHSPQSFIFIVDSDPVNVKILYEMLQSSNFYVTFSHEPSSLFTMLDKGKIPDLVILDTILPGTSAFEVSEKIRQQYSLYELPIMIITSKHHTQEIITAFRMGANDYISKPYNKDELIARITNLITLKKSVQEHNEYIMLKHEIRLAHKIHNSVVIHDIPKVENLTIAYAYIPTREMGGDFYDVIPIDTTTTGIIIADVTGHGIPAALVCAMLKMAIVNNTQYMVHPSLFLTHVNKDLSNTIKENYITIAYALINTQQKTITVSSAGHWPPILVGNDGKIYENTPKGFPIGWDDTACYQEVLFHYHSSNKLILYTDGIIEASNSDNKIFGIERLYNYSTNNKTKDPNNFVNGLIHNLSSWTGMKDNTFKDDLTIIVVELL
ncbi:MAG: SpoIIE family protein phosphatase [Spirochaetota bacterium]